MTHPDDLMTQGMKCLIDNLGIIEAQRFIVLVKSDKSDYTEWQRDYFDSMTPEEFRTSLEEFIKQHPDDKNFCKGESLNEVRIHAEA